MGLFMKNHLGQAQDFDAGEKESLEVSNEISMMSPSDRSSQGDNWMKRLVSESAAPKHWSLILLFFFFFF